MNQTYKCQYEGHEEEGIIGFCLDKQCQYKVQYCSECLISYHSSHQKICKTMPKLKQIIKNFETQINDWLKNIEESNNKIQQLYQKTVKLLTIKKNRMIELEKHLQNEEYQQIIERIYTIKQINFYQETKQEIKSNNLQDMLNEIIYQLESLVFDQKQIQNNQKDLSLHQDNKLVGKLADKEKEEDVNKEISQIILEEGITHINNARYHDAILCIDDAIQVNKNNGTAYREKGICVTQIGWALLILGKQKEAIECFDKALVLNNKDAVAYFRKGWALDDQQCYKEAIQCFDQAIKLEGKWKEVYYAKGSSLYKLNRNDEAIQCYDFVILLDPKYKDAYNNKGGLSLFQLTRYEEAVNCYDQAIKLDSSSKEAYNHKGLSLRKLNRYEEAIKCYDKAISLDSKYRDAYNNKGLLLFQLDCYEEALKCYDQAIKIDPKCKEAYHNKATLLNTQNRFEEALKCLDQAILIDSKYNLAIVNKRETLEALRRNKQK